MRVLHFVSSYHPVTGGTTTRVHNLLSAMDPEVTHELFVTWPPSAPDAPEEEQAGSVRIHRVSLGGNGPEARIPFLRERHRMRKLLEASRGIDVDVIHGHNPYVCAWAASEAAASRRLPMVYEVHGIMRDFSNFPKLPAGLGFAKAPYERVVRTMLGRVEGRVLGRARHILCQTQASWDRLQTMYPIGDKPMTVVRNGVDAEFFAPAAWDAAAKEIREEYAWGSQIIIMYAGYLDEVNGIRFVVECLSQLPPEVQGKVRFVFLGRGPNARMLEKAQEEYPELVQYIGSVAYDRIPSFYGACDVFMVPRPSTAPAESLLPVKLLEAMAMEKAVLVSDVAAMAETVAHGESGLVFRKGEPASFVEEVTGIARGKYDLSGLGVRAREIVASEFSWKRSAAATRAAYRQALGDG